MAARAPNPPIFQSFFGLSGMATLRLLQNAPCVVK
jgi:hypothetical protein